ncbi:serine/threonine protein kinase [Solemya velesiana gill symbiont]|uniref:Protein kinase domain-containing protein n=1 Tax=Solemya velesiana gill symbiont TaxID=1918948 RepID=A0A1T2KWK8_9GAMM|nr:serine/threonine-protein kinase [Solemya velesiana gill symbiont]OOZ37204.1 hypothetical protein BOW51_03555 [Solemya velesiana gill symbiont]
MNSEIGIKIPGYRIEKLVAKSGMASVYLATQSSLGRPVALKVLTDPETPQFFERFFNEGRYVAKLSHNNLVAIYDIGQGEGFYYIAMEYLPGGNLKTKINQGIRPKSALKLISQVATCLSYVHSQGLVHRDIKPSNILFRSDGSPVLTDFGIAKLMQTDNDLTVTGTVMGSPHYLSSELAQGERKLDGRSDIYSLGVILYEMLTGKKPYSGESYAATLMAHIQQPVPTLPEKFHQYQPLLEKMMAKEPGQRFQTGGEVMKAIQDLRVQTRKERKQEEKKRHHIQQTPLLTRERVLQIALTLGVLVLATWLFMPSGDQTVSDQPPAIQQPPVEATAPATQPGIQADTKPADEAASHPPSPDNGQRTTETTR